MNLSQVVLRGAEIWHIGKQPHLIECFWKILKSIFHIRSMPLPGNGLYTALLIKVFAYVLALRLQAHRPFSQLTITQIMRNLRRDHTLKDLLTGAHFSAGRAGIATKMRYAFGLPRQGFHRRPIPDAMPTRQHTP
jgi:hypothetical protein